MCSTPKTTSDWICRSTPRQAMRESDPTFRALGYDGAMDRQERIAITWDFLIPPPPGRRGVITPAQWRLIALYSILTCAAGVFTAVYFRHLPHRMPIFLWCAVLDFVLGT